MINSPFQRPKNREKFPGIDSGETEYIDRQIFLEFVQTGLDENGKAIGSVQPVVHEKKTNIEETVNASANKCGLKNVLARFANTGDESFVRNELPCGDYSVGLDKSPEEIYATLPPELTQGMTLDQFVKNFNSDMFAKFINSLKEDKKEEEVTENE